MIGINPNDENYGYLIGSDDKLVQTNNGWGTSQIFDINQLANPLLKKYAGDPKIAFTKDGKITISSLFWQPNGAEQYLVTGGIYQDTFPKNFPAQLKQTILQDVPNNLGPNDWLLFDYEKMAIDTDPNSSYFNSVYVFAHYMWFDNLENGSHYGPGVLISIQPEMLPLQPLIRATTEYRTKTKNEAEENHLHHLSLCSV